MPISYSTYYSNIYYILQEAYGCELQLMMVY